MGRGSSLRADRDDKVRSLPARKERRRKKGHPKGRPFEFNPATLSGSGAETKLPRVEFDHEVRFHLDRIRDVGEGCNTRQRDRHLVVIGVDVVRHVALGALDGFEYESQLLGLLFDLDHIANTDAIARYRDAMTVDRHMAVADELTGREHGRNEFGAVHESVKPALKQTDEKLRRRALQTRGLVGDGAELTLGDRGVIAFQLLLGFELLAEIGKFALAALAVLAGTAIATVEGALRAAPDVFAEAAVDFMLSANTLRHLLALHELSPAQRSHVRSAWSAPSSALIGRPTAMDLRQSRHGCANQTRAQRPAWIG